MATDEEYLTEAGLNSDGNPNPSGEVEKTPVAETPQAASEMFEFDWNNQKHKFPTNVEFPITHNGQIKKVPAATLFNAYRQAEHFEDKNKMFRGEVDKFKTEFADAQKWKAFHDKYGELQTWSESKPEEFQAIWDMYQNRNKHLLEHQAGLNPSSEQPGQQAPDVSKHLKPFVDKIAELENKISGFDSFKKGFDDKQVEEQQKADVDFVKGEIETFKKDFPEINLEEADPDGVSLWAKIINYGVQNGYPDFESAALKFLKPRLLDTVSFRARNDAAKGIQKDKQQGIVKRSSTPASGQSTGNIDPRKHSWSELGDMAKAEYERLTAQGN